MQLIFKLIKLKKSTDKNYFGTPKLGKQYPLANLVHVDNDLKSASFLCIALEGTLNLPLYACGMSLGLLFL